MKKWLSVFSGFDLPVGTTCPPYLQSSQLFPSVAIVYHLREMAFENMFSSNSITYQQQNPALRFSQLSAEVLNDCYYATSPDVIQRHPAYTKILAMGREAIPFLIFQLDENPTYWFRALSLIAGENQNP